MSQFAEKFDIGDYVIAGPEHRKDNPVPDLGTLATQYWKDARSVSNNTASAVNYEEAYEAVNARIKAATGRDVANPMRELDAWAPRNPVNPFEYFRERKNPHEAWAESIRKLQAEQPDVLPWDDLLGEPKRMAYERMKAIREQTGELERQRGLVTAEDMGAIGKVPVLGTAAAFLRNAVKDPAATAVQVGAGFGASMTSAPDAAVNLLGFGAGGKTASVVKNAFANAGVNALGQMPLSALKQEDYKQAGLPYGFKAWLQEVEGAAVAGAVIDAGVRGPARVFRSQVLGDKTAGGFFRDAPAPKDPMEGLAPDVIQKANALEPDALRKVAEHIGRADDPVIRGAISQLENGKLDDNARAFLKEMGVDPGYGFAMLNRALTDETLLGNLPEPIRQATAPMAHDAVAELYFTRSDDLDKAMASLPPEVASRMQGGLDAGIPGVVELARKLLDGERPEKGMADLDASLGGKLDDMIIIHAGRGNVLDVATAMRRSPELVDSNVPMGTEAMRAARALAGLDELAWSTVARGEASPGAGVAVAELVPPEMQTRVLGDLARAGVQSAAEARALIPDLMPREPLPPLNNGAKVDDPSGPAAKRQVEVLTENLKNEIEAAETPLRTAEEARARAEQLRGEIATLERQLQQGFADALQAGSDGKALSGVSDKLRMLRDELAAIEMAQRSAADDVAALSKVRENFQAAVESGDEYRVPTGIITSALAELRRLADGGNLPDARIGVVAQVKPTLGDATTVDVTLIGADNRAFVIPMAKAFVVGSRAFYSPSTGTIGFFRYDAVANGDKRFSGELRHETLHHLRTSGVVEDGDFRQLVAHSDSYRIFDMKMGLYLRVIGDPAEFDASSVTLRKVYAEAYSTRPDFEEVMNQEKVAHMLELAAHGVFTAEQLAPIQGLIDKYGLLERPAAPAVPAEGPQTFGPMTAMTEPRLDMSREARMARAEAMGFDTSTVWYHGTNAEFDAFDATRGSGGVWLTLNKEAASAFGAPGEYYIKANKFGSLMDFMKARVAAVQSGVEPNSPEFGARVVENLKSAGIDGIRDAKFKGVGGVGEEVIMLVDPANIRSVNAAFDPTEAQSPRLLAAVRAITEGRAAMKAAASQGVELPGGTKVDGVLLALKAFHGTPHEVDRFRMDKIGTGEGAQAYGYGLYFAESEGVARSYQDKLSKPGAITIDGKPLHLARLPTPQYSALEVIERIAAKNGGNVDAALVDLRSRGLAHIAEAFELVRPRAKVSPPGNLYEVRLNVEPEDLLDWDKPLSEQSEKVRTAALSVLPQDKRTYFEKWASDPEVSARDVYEQIGSAIAPGDGKNHASPKVASALREAGILGIRYLDQASRGTGSGTSNFVIFDDSLIEIVAKNGKPVRGDMAALGGQAAETADRQALARANTMEMDGARREDIWQETGWFRGIDGRWRFEINDANAKYDMMTALERDGGKAAELLSHEELYRAYPGARNIDVVPRRAGGSYNPATNRMEIGNVDGTRKALHEMQHYIQDVEGFATGSSPAMTGGADAYRRMAGEVEARVVEKRQKMTPEQRRARPPWLDYDVAEADQIVSGNRPAVFGPMSAMSGRGLGAEKQPRLSAMHNVTVENLLFADEMGGIAAPSIAVLKEGMGISGFGDITLIGRKSLVDPQQNPVFDADAWTARFPRPEYKAAPSAKAQQFVDEMRPFAIEFADTGSMHEAWDYLVNNPSPERNISQLLRSEAAQAMFLKSKGVTVKPVMRSAEQSMRNGYVAMPAFRDFIAKNPEYRDARPGDPIYIEMSEAIAKAVEQRVDTQMAKSNAPNNAELRAQLLDASKSGLFGEDGQIFYGATTFIASDLAKIGKSEVDVGETRKALEKKLKGKEPEFKKWLEERLMPMYGDPRLKLGGKFVPYTLENITEQMTSSRTTQGQEDSMFFSEGKARAAGAVRFNDLETMRSAARDQMAPEADVAAAREAAKIKMEAWRNSLMKSYKYYDSKRFGSGLDAMDASMRAIAKWAKTKGKTVEDLARALRSEEFVNVPRYVLEEGVDAGNAFMKAPVPYFESKPQRAVKLNEFAGAVIPKGAPREVRDILEKYGIKVVQYARENGDPNAQMNAAAQLTQRLSKKDPDVLFALSSPSDDTPPLQANLEQVHKLSRLRELALACKAV